MSQQRITLLQKPVVMFTLNFGGRPWTWCFDNYEFFLCLWSCCSYCRHYCSNIH